MSAASCVGEGGKGDNIERSALLIGGPTASGKSALALRLAEALGGTVVNADSMQLYRELAIVTARPGPAELARAPHRLYGVLPAARPASAGRWRSMALAEIDAALAAGSLPIVVGGTGLYLKALVEDLPDIPDIPPAIRAEAASRHSERGGEAFRRDLARLDPEAASRLAAGDTQRLIRAWEVATATGRPLSAWQRDRAGVAPARPASDMPASGAPAVDMPAVDMPTVDMPAFDMIVLLPPREPLYAACDRRLAAMVEAGALDEVRALDRLGLDPGLPLMKALGVPELLQAAEGGRPLAEAIAAAQQATRRYAKRQLTWFRHQPLRHRAALGRLFSFRSQYSEKIWPEIVNFVGEKR